MSETTSVDHEAQAQRVRRGKSVMIFGSVVAGLGLSITFETFAKTASSGGLAIVAYGAIIGGAYAVYRGIRLIKMP